jgi:hypothetical protein
LHSSGDERERGNYNYSTDVLHQTDKIFCKYSLKTSFADCGIDNIYVEGESYVSAGGDYFDYLTLKYGYTGTPCGGPNERHAYTDDEVKTGLYPNPFATTAILKLSPETVINNAVLSVYDISGRLVSSVNNITSTDISISRGYLKSGLYYYSLTDNGTIITNGKFIITEE